MKFLVHNIVEGLALYKMMDSVTFSRVRREKEVATKSRSNRFDSQKLRSSHMITCIFPVE